MSAKTAKVITPRSTSLGSLKASELLKKLLASQGVLTIPAFYSTYVPRYESVNYGRFIQIIKWQSEYAHAIERISEKRSQNRAMNYLVDEEIERVKAKLDAKGEASVRFGSAKKGHGYNGERGDFCLVGGAIKNHELTVFYRSLELIGGLAYDLTLFDRLSVNLRREWNTITIIACKAFIFALKGNSNEKLYPKLRRIFSET